MIFKIVVCHNNKNKTRYKTVCMEYQRYRCNCPKRKEILPFKLIMNLIIKFYFVVIDRVCRLQNEDKMILLVQITNDSFSFGAGEVGKGGHAC